ncbi:MAG: ECF transporter S component [Clostridia bacterium]|nr:ECF transporter S component [Clostridia bacterium]
MNTKARKKTEFIVKVAMLGAVATILMLIEFPLPFIAPPFYELDFSEVPVLIGTFAMGPLAGVLIELIKVLLNLAINGTITAGVGELANFVVGCAFIIPAGLIYKHKKTKLNALLGLIAGTVSMTIISLPVNAFVMVPAYIMLAGFEESMIVGMGNSIFPFVDSILDLALCCAVPFNFIKGVVISVVTFVLYKPINPLLKKISF